MNPTARRAARATSSLLSTVIVTAIGGWLMCSRAVPDASPAPTVTRIYSPVPSSPRLTERGMVVIRRYGDAAKARHSTYLLKPA